MTSFARLAERYGFERQHYRELARSFDPVGAVIADSMIEEYEALWDEPASQTALPRKMTAGQRRRRDDLVNLLRFAKVSASDLEQLEAIATGVELESFEEAFGVPPPSAFDPADPAGSAAGVAANSSSVDSLPKGLPAGSAGSSLSAGNRRRR